MLKLENQNKYVLIHQHSLEYSFKEKLLCGSLRAGEGIRTLVLGVEDQYTSHCTTPASKRIL